MTQKNAEEKINAGVWIDNSTEFSNQTDAICTKDFENISIDQAKYNYFKEYQREYFYDEFIPGWGTEDILDFLAKYHKEGTLLDVGAGTTTVLWLTVMDKIQSASCADIEIEALKVLYEFCHSDEIPECYNDISALFNKPISSVDKSKNKISEYFTYDISQNWPDFVTERSFDNISTIGVLGTTASPAKLIKTVNLISNSLKYCGIYLGADWIRKKHLIKYDGIDTSFLSEDLIKTAIKEASLTLLDMKRVEYLGDDHYQGVIV